MRFSSSPACSRSLSSCPLLYIFQDVEQAYKGRTVLSVARWSVRRGTVLGLVGPNGSGKSTLLRLMGFVEFPVRGTIFFEGRRISRKDAQALRLEVTLLPQDPYLLDRTVADNVAYGLSVRGVRRGRAARVQEALQWVGLDPGVFGGRSVRALSGGEARRTALAARLAVRPQVLLLDEPTAEIDEDSVQRVRSAILHARSNWGATVVVTSHDREWLLTFCDEIQEMRDGRLTGPIAAKATIGVQ